jgi:hypothetical protein
MTDWRPVNQPRDLDGATVQTVRAAFTNETGHELHHGLHTLRVLPDGVTTSRKRSCIISESYAAVQHAQASHDQYCQADEAHLDPLVYVIGALVAAGATRLELDGVPLTPIGTRGIDLAIRVTDDELVVRKIGGIE